LETYKIHHLVKAGDLNHHGTLFAGRTAEWFVEAGFIAAAGQAKPENIVCLNIHGMKFTRPVPSGSIVCLESRLVLAGKTSLVAHIQSEFEGEIILSGFITFVHVDEMGKSLAHHVTIEAHTEEEQALQEQARQLRKS
jgi:acyl-CoA hydrolase